MTTKYMKHMLIMPSLPIIQVIGRTGSPLISMQPALPVPIVPIIHLLSVVVISNKGITGMYMRICARKSFKPLGIDMGTWRFLCARN